ncbi:MAG: hypothetical protein LBO82_03225 [Synergistaceae bacterium]|nr:hypothetical protein [Synergistaceae bacterium]
MRKKMVLTAAAVLFLFAETAFAAYDISGKWLLEGGGYAKKDVLRVELTDEGALDIRTRVENGVRYVSGYSVNLRLDASRLGINAWKYEKVVELSPSVPIPDLDPTLNDPFKLPPVTVDKLTYEVTFTSIHAGTVKIHGNLDVDVVGEIDIDSDSAIWKEGTEKPDIPDTTSGCNSGIAGMTLILGTALILVFSRTSDKSAHGICQSSVKR